MSNLKFAKTHNLIAFLEKPKESDGFEGIIGFLNASSIRYALTVNPTIYTSCIKQFWATAKEKIVNGEVHIQALVDVKKMIITETSVRRALQLKDAEGTECLPNVTIFEQLTLMGYENLTQKLTFYKSFFSPQWKFLIHTILQCISAKTTTWNEFSNTIASAVICLATNQKFNFSKCIFDNMVKNLEGGVKFLMYPRFVQVFLDKQVEGMIKHKEIYVTPSHTKKVFANMKRGGKGFSRRVTPLFQTMMVQAPEELDIEVPQPSGSTKPNTDEAANAEHVPTHSNDPHFSGEDRLKLNELMELCIKLSERVLDLENTKTSKAAEITKLKERVKKMERRNMSRTPRLKRLRKVGVFDEQEVKVEKAVSTAEVTTVSATTTTVDELTLAQTLIEIKAAKPKVVTTAATTTTTAITRPKAKGVIVQEPSEFRTTISSLQTSQLLRAKDKGKAEMIEPENPLKKKDQILIDEEIAQSVKLIQKAFDKTMGWIDSFVSMDSEVVKRDDDQEEAEMKKHMEIVVNEEEIAVDAIPLATKPTIIVDRKIINEGKIGYFQLIRVDGSSRRSRILEVFECILLVKIKLLIKKHEDSEDEHQVLGRIVGIKRLHDDLRVITAKVKDTDAKYNLLLLVIISEKYAK
ncbi:hypothetical protein Tco_1083234 [Tanacetum coccineum]